jgi:hypothetical protein
MMRTRVINVIGVGIFVTHSQSGGSGWRTALNNSHIRAIVSYEPGGDFIFPEGEAPAAIKFSGRSFNLEIVPFPDFMRFTRIPIVIYFGENIPEVRRRIPVRSNGERSLRSRGNGEMWSIATAVM